MASPNTSHLDKGFTLLETLVVMGIFIVLMGVGGVIAFSSYKGYLFRSERSTAVSVLERARSRAMANYEGKKHGVCYDQATHSYVIFEGTLCQVSALDNEIIKGNPNTVVDWKDPVIFDQLRARVSTTGTSGDCVSSEQRISITEGERTSNICINTEGRINW